MIKRKVIRILVVEGDESWVNMTLRTSHIAFDKPLDLGRGNRITEILREEVLKEERVNYDSDHG